MKNIIIAIGLIFLPFISYSQKNENDENLKQYYEKGIPSLNKNWTAQEFVNTINSLVHLSENNILTLPNNNNGKEILIKITDFENYWFLEDRMISDKDKMFYCMDVQKSISQLYLKYNQENILIGEKLKYSNELILIQKTLINLTDKMIELTDQFIIKNPNLTELQKDGLKKMRLGLNTFISGSLLIINEEYIYYYERDICDLSKVFVHFYKKYRNSIDEVTKTQFDKEINLINKSHNLECVKKNLMLE